MSNGPSPKPLGPPPAALQRRPRRRPRRCIRGRTRRLQRTLGGSKWVEVPALRCPLQSPRFELLPRPSRSDRTSNEPWPRPSPSRRNQLMAARKGPGPTQLREGRRGNRQRAGRRRRTNDAGSATRGAAPRTRHRHAEPAKRHRTGPIHKSLWISRRNRPRGVRTQGVPRQVQSPISRWNLWVPAGSNAPVTSTSTQTMWCRKIRGNCTASIARAWARPGRRVSVPGRLTRRRPTVPNQPVPKEISWAFSERIRTHESDRPRVRWEQAARAR